MLSEQDRERAKEIAESMTDLEILVRLLKISEEEAKQILRNRDSSHKIDDMRARFLVHAPEVFITQAAPST